MSKRTNALGTPCPITASRLAGALPSPTNTTIAADCAALALSSLTSVRATTAAHVGINPGTAFASASADVGVGFVHAKAHAHNAAWRAAVGVDALVAAAACVMTVASEGMLWVLLLLLRGGMVGGLRVRE